MKHLVFVYGTLKQGFPNFARNRGTRVPGLFTTVQRYPLYLVGERCSPRLLDHAGEGERVTGEVYETDDDALVAMDALERICEPDGYRRVELQLEPSDGSAPIVAFAYLKPADQLVPADVREGPVSQYTLEHAARYSARTTSDTGSQLRSLYAPQGGTGQIFSAKVHDYVASRPDYPASLFEALRTGCHLSAGAVVADVGAGTGLLTQGLLAQGYAVTAIEPSDSMRAAADHALSHFAGYRSASGTAEQLPLPDASVDLITAAQAFHWFDITPARTEFLRVLKPRGQVALIWNDRLAGDPLHGALDAIFAKYGGAKRGAMLAHDERSEVPAFFGTTTPVELTWPHAHHLDENALLSLVFSRSYMPARDSAAGLQASQEVSELFQRLANDGRITVRYTTVVFIGRPG